MRRRVLSVATTDRTVFPRVAQADDGSSLVIVLLLSVLIAAIGSSLALVASMDTLMAANHRDGLATRHTAEGVADVVVHELAQAGDWTRVLNGATVSGLAGPLVLPPALGGLVVPAPAATTALQQETFGSGPWGANTPRWRLYGHGVPGVHLPSAGLSDRVYALVWVSDDVGEVDGNPYSDTNDVILVRVRAMGPRRSQADVQVVVARVAPGIVRRLSSRVIP